VILVEPTKNGHGAISLNENRSITLRSGLPKERERNRTEPNTLCLIYVIKLHSLQVLISRKSNHFSELRPLIHGETNMTEGAEYGNFRKTVAMKLESIKLDLNRLPKYHTHEM